nr:biotin carboxyl carrier protein of acetyl-CoA carboxylase, chloroplastic-like [Procambarus clarkii]
MSHKYEDPYIVAEKVGDLTYKALPENTEEAAATSPPLDPSLSSSPPQPLQPPPKPAVTTNNTFVPALLHLADKLAGNDVNLYVHTINRLLTANGLPTVTVPFDLLPAPPPAAGPASNPATGPTTSLIKGTPPSLATSANEDITSRDDNGPPKTPLSHQEALQSHHRLR